MISDAIVKRIFDYFGVPATTGTFSVLSKQYVIKKELSIELDDGEVLQKNIWGVEGKVGVSTIRALVADTTIDNDNQEYILVFRLDDLSIHALKFENNGKFIGKGFFAHDGAGWVELTGLLMAKLLVGVEQLNELFIEYKPLTNYQELYQQLISFLNYEEASQNNK